MAFEARRSPLAQFGRDAARYPVEYPPPVDGSRVLSHAEAYYQTPPPAGFSACELASPESSYQWNLQARVLYDEMMKVSERKLNVNTRPNRGFNYHRMDDLLEDELAASDVQSPRHYEDGSCYSPRTAGRMGTIPIHQRGSSPTSVLDHSGDAWNLLYEATGRLNHMDLNSELHSHLLDRSSYLVSRQMGSPRSSPLSNSPFAPSGNSSYHGVNVGYHYESGLPNLCGMNPEVQNWSNGYGMMAAPVHPSRHQGRKLGPGLVSDRGFQMASPHSNPRAPMRAVFVTERSGHPRESTGTGVFLPRCVGGGPDFNRKPTCAPVLLPMWSECSSPRKPLETPMAAAAHRQPLVPPPVQVLERHGASAPSSGDMGNLNPSQKPACKKSQKSLQYESSSVAEVRELDDVDLPPEWVY